MMLLAVFLAGINVLYVLGTAACAAFDGMLDLCFECGLCCAFCKKGVLLYNARNNYARVTLVANLCVDAK